MPPEQPTTRSAAHLGRSCVSALAIFASLVCCQSQEPQPEGVLEISEGDNDESNIFIRMRSGLAYRARSENEPQVLSVRDARAVNDIWYIDHTGALFFSPDSTRTLPYEAFVRTAAVAPVVQVGPRHFRDAVGEMWAIVLKSVLRLEEVPALRSATACSSNACIVDGRVVSDRFGVDWKQGVAKEIVGGYARRYDGFYEYASNVLTEDGAVWTVASDGNIVRVEGLPTGEHLSLGVLFERDGSAWSWGVQRGYFWVFGESKGGTDCYLVPGLKGPTGVKCAVPERMPALDGMEVVITGRYVFTIDRNRVAKCFGYFPYDTELHNCPPLPWTP